MRIVLFATIFIWVLGAAAAEVAGVRFDDKVHIASDTPELILNGAGVRTRFFVVKVYAAGLYLIERTTAPNDILVLGGPKRVAMTMLRDVTAPQFTQALSDGFKANNSAVDQERYKVPLDTLVSVMNAIGKASNQDVISLDYLPDSGMHVLVNGQQQGAPIGDAGFYRALLKVWIGDQPVDTSLKQNLLGQD